MADAGSERPFKGRLEQYGDKAAPRPLHPGARVMAQLNGNPNLAWYPGVATLQNAHGSWHIQYDDGDDEDLVSSTATERMCRARRKLLLGIAVPAGPSPCAAYAVKGASYGVPVHAHRPPSGGFGVETPFSKCIP